MPETEESFEDVEPGLAAIHGVHEAGKHNKTGSPWMQELSFKERLENLNKQFKDPDISDYYSKRNK